MAVVLVLLLLWLRGRRDVYIAVAILAHLITMAVPQFFRPLAVLWFGLSHVMGSVVSRVMLTLIFFLVVTPIALWRKAFGSDALKLKAFKQGRGSVMKQRHYTYVGKDLEQPY